MTRFPIDGTGRLASEREHPTAVLPASVANVSSPSSNKVPDMWVAPSGDATGVTDVAALNAALATGRRVRGQTGGTYYLNAPIYLVSGGTLDMTGCVINQVAGTLLNMIRNKAVDPTTTATDGATGAGSAVLTSTTLAAVAQVGDAIQVVNASYGGNCCWYGTVLSVNAGAHQITLSCPAKVTIASGATCYRYATRDSDITLIGGHWKPVDLGAGTTPLTQFVSCFRRVDRLTVRNVICTQPGTRGLGGRFVLSFGDVTELTVNNIHFPSTAGDGVHVFGPAAAVSITDIYGNTGDDFVAVNSVDAFNPGWGPLIDTQGDVTDVIAERLFPNGAASVADIYSSDADATFKMDNITVRGGHAQTPVTAYGVLVTAGGGTTSVPMSGILIEDIAASASSGNIYNATVVIRNAGADVVVRNCRQPVNFGAPVVSVRDYGCNSLVIDGVKIVTSNSAVLWLEGLASTVSMSRIDYDGTAGLGPGDSIIFCDGAGAITDLLLHDITCIATRLAWFVQTSALTIRCSGIKHTGTNLFVTTAPTTVLLTNAVLNTSGAVVQVNGAPATPVTGIFSNYKQAGAGALMAKNSTQTVTQKDATYTTTAI